MQIDPGLVDHARNILEPLPMSMGDKANIWDRYHSAQSSKELAANLQSVPSLPDETRQRLIDAKKLSDSELGPLDKVFDVVNRLGKMDRGLLDLAEKYPTVLRAMLENAEDRE